MKLKHIKILALIAFMLFGYTAEAKKKQAMVSFPVLKTKIEGFYLRVIEIDQESIEFDIKNTTITLQFKKIAEFPYDYTPRIERLEISTIGSDDENVEILLSPNYYEPSISLTELTKLINSPVGSTAKVKIAISTINDLKEIQGAFIDGLAITKLIIVDQAEYEEAVDFVLKIKDAVLSKDQSKLEELVDYYHTLPNGDKWYDSTDPESEEPEIDIPIEPAAIKKLTRADLLDGEVIASKSVKKNQLSYFNLFFDNDSKCYSFVFWDTAINSDEFDGIGYCVHIKIAKVNGEYKIVWMEVIDN